jgi:hypothetical protein
LTSNGVPRWYTADGNPHTATSRTWLHQPSGRYGVAARPGEQRHGYLPLTPLPGQRGCLYDTLEAARQNQHWMTIQLPADPLISDPLISYPRIELSSERRDGYPPDLRWEPATVACVPATGPNIYPAVVAHDYSSSAGGQLVRFDRSTIDQMISDLSSLRAHDLSMPGKHTVLRWHRDVVVVYDEIDGGGYREYDQVSPDADGLYPLGSYTWPWLTVDD